MAPTLETLPSDVLSVILSFLSPHEAAALCLTHSSFSRAPLDHLYRRWCLHHFNQSALSGPHESFKQLYASSYRAYGRYLPCFARISRAWEFLENRLEGLVELKPGATEEELDMAERQIGAKLPMELRCSYRLHNGQTLGLSGLVGGYQVYDYVAEFYLLELENIVAIHQAVVKMGPKTLGANSLQFAMSFASRDHYHISINQDAGVPPGTVFVCTNALDLNIGYYPRAPDFATWLEDHAEKIRSNMYEVTNDGIKLFEKTTSNAVTNGVKVEVRTVFVPRLSNERCHFAYKIRMTMAEDVPKSFSAQLTTRHWIIESDRTVEEVKGPGVIGLFPKMFPGADFEYSSCTNAKTLPIVMRGTFQMVQQNGALYDAIVDPFVMEVDFVSPQTQQHMADQNRRYVEQVVNEGLELLGSGEIKQAHKKFSRARALSPSSVKASVGNVISLRLVHKGVPFPASVQEEWNSEIQRLMGLSTVPLEASVLAIRFGLSTGPQKGSLIFMGDPRIEEALRTIIDG